MAVIELTTKVTDAQKNRTRPETPSIDCIRATWEGMIIVKVFQLRAKALPRPRAVRFCGDSEAEPSMPTVNWWALMGRSRKTSPDSAITRHSAK